MINNILSVFTTHLITPQISAGFSVFHAVSQSATECAQQLWRYRPDGDTQLNHSAIGVSDVDFGAVSLATRIVY